MATRRDSFAPRMTMLTQTVVLMVDDDLDAHTRIRALLPAGTTFRSAYTAIEGIQLFHRLALEDHRAAILILDYRLPDLDGGLLAAKAREILPQAVILAFSSLRDSGPPMGFSGATIVPKAINDGDLRQLLAQVIAEPAITPPDPVIMPYLASHATTLALLRTQSTSVAVLAGSRPVLTLITTGLQEAQVAVAAQSMNASVLETTLKAMPLSVLVTHGPVWARAQEIAEERTLELLVVSLSLSLAISLVVEAVSIALAPEAATLAAAIAAMRAGERYRDPHIIAAYNELGLTPAERELLPYLLRDRSSRQIGDVLGTVDTNVRKLTSRLFAKLQVETSDELRTAIDNLMVT